MKDTLKVAGVATGAALLGGIVGALTINKMNKESYEMLLKVKEERDNLGKDIDAIREEMIDNQKSINESKKDFEDSKEIIDMAVESANEKFKSMKDEYSKLNQKIESSSELHKTLTNDLVTKMETVKDSVLESINAFDKTNSSQSEKTKKGKTKTKNKDSEG